MMDTEKLQAGAKLYEQYNTVMLKLAKRYLPNIYDAEDVVSNCWLRLLPRIHILMEMDDAARSSYLLTAVKNESIDYYRRQDRSSLAWELNQKIDDASVVDEFETLCTCDAFSSMLKMLPTQESRVVQCKLYGMTNEDIARQFHVNQSTVRVYWSRGIARLRLLVQALGK